MTDVLDKRFRRLLYLLTELESSLRAAGRPAAPESIGILARRFGQSAAEAFLEECRTELEAILLGERDLPVEFIGQVMDALASVDETLRNVPE